MQAFTWLRKCMTGRSDTRCRPARKPTPRFRPQLEALDGRCLPSTLTVTNNLDSGPGSLRADIAAAHNKDTIVFAPSLNGQTITLTSGSLLISQKNLTIRGPGASQLTVSGNHNSRVFVIEPGVNVNLSGLTISNGIASKAALFNDGIGDGGGIYNGGTLTVTGCILSGNGAAFVGSPSSGEGGGIYNAGTITLSGCTLSDNSASYLGGGMYNAGTATVSGCTFTWNSAQVGGGISNAAMLTVSSSFFSYNFGGAIDGGYTDGGGNTFN